MHIHLTLNGEQTTWDTAPHELLLTALRRAGMWSVKHGCETGDCGACAVLLNGKLVNTCTRLAVQAHGAAIETLEHLAPDQPGRRDNDLQASSPPAALHPLQRAFIETGAIQCGFCTPAQLLAAKALLDQNPHPSEDQVREAIAGVLCRCTGYARPVQAVLRAAAILRGEAVLPVEMPRTTFGSELAAQERPALADDTPEFPDDSFGGRPTDTLTRTRMPVMVVAQPETRVVNKAETKVDAVKLAKGRPVFTDDMTLPGMLHAALLTSPHAHARIRAIDATAARALEGVHAVLTYQDIPRVMYASGGQSYPQPHPYDQASLDSKVRHVGDRVAVVAAETPEIAQARARADRGRLRGAAGRP